MTGETVALCPFCLEGVEEREKDGVHHVICPRCGKYRITDEAYEESTIKLNDRQRTNLSGWLLENQNYFINTKNFDSLRKIKTPSFFDRADRILLSMEKQTEYIGQYITFNKKWLTFSWCINDRELYEILEYLLQNRMIARNPEFSVSDDYKINPAGWNRIGELLKINTDSQQGFVAMWFDDLMQDVYDRAISPGILDAGYRPHRVDLREHNGKIDDEIIAQIRRSRFVLADFTGQRGGVYYEAGFGKGLGLEVFWTCKADEMDKLHFDIRQYNCIDWEADKLPEFRKRISNRIESVLGRGTYKQEDR